MDNRVKDRYDEVFSIEIDGWCYGIQNYPGEIFAGLVHAVLRELAVSYRAAIDNGLVFNVHALAEKITKAARYIVTEKEVAFSILNHLPNPSELDENGQFVLGQIVDQVEQAYGGALERLQRKWAHEQKLAVGRQASRKNAA